jgi:hypothetical protein
MSTLEGSGRSCWDCIHGVSCEWPSSALVAITAVISKYAPNWRESLSTPRHERSLVRPGRPFSAGYRYLPSSVCNRRDVRERTNLDRRALPMDAV